MKRILFGLAYLIVCNEAARILITAQLGSKSHHNTYIPIINELTLRGHWVTFITNYQCNELKNNERVQLIVLEKLAANFNQHFNNFTTLTGSNFWKKMELLFDSTIIHSITLLIVRESFEHVSVQKLLQNDTYDLVLVSQSVGSTGYSLACHYNVPFILVSSNDMIAGAAISMGDSDHTEYVPFSLSSFTDRMTVMERLMNTLMTSYFQTTVDGFRAVAEKEIGKYLPKCSSLKEMEKNVSLYLTNTHPTFSYPRVLPPDVIEIGAIHCRPAKPLPTELETFASSAYDGFIVFAIGTNNLMSDMPDEWMQSFLTIFSRLPQRVLWQWNGPKKFQLPGNIMTVDWLPQQDLLGHPNCRLFLTHGGLSSLQEAIYHGVPILGLPFGRDQRRNMNLAVRRGYALQLEWKDVTQDSLNVTIHNLLHNPKYKANAKRLSSLLRDQLETPLERAVYWIEYVLRHNGSHLLRLASRDLAPYQRALMDVYGILVIVILLPILFSAWCIRKFCCSKKTMKNDQDAKNFIDKKRKRQ